MASCRKGPANRKADESVMLSPVETEAHSVEYLEFDDQYGSRHLLTLLTLGRRLGPACLRRSPLGRGSGEREGEGGVERRVLAALLSARTGAGRDDALI